MMPPEDIKLTSLSMFLRAGETDLLLRKLEMKILMGNESFSKVK